MQNQEAHRCAGVKAKEPVCTIRRLVTYRGTEKGSTRLSTMRADTVGEADTAWKRREASN